MSDDSTEERGRPGMRSLAVAFPSVLRTNDHWRRHFPEMVADAERFTLAKLWSAQERPAQHAPSLFQRAMGPYLEDPFRGAVERRWRAEGEPALAMELEAARGALAAAELGADDIDLTLVTSFVPDRFGVGNAAHLAEELELSGPAWNFESACSGSVVGLHMASDLVASGSYQRILVVASTSNSIQVDGTDSLGWFIGDGAGAFVVEAQAPGYGVLGRASINSTQTNDMFVIHSVPKPGTEGATRLVTTAHPDAAKMATETAETYLLQCVDGALEDAGSARDDIDFWIFNTPNAWYADFCASVLGISSERYHSVYPRYANIGAALMPATLYHAIDEGLIEPGHRIGIYSIGSTATASAIVMRVPRVGLGPFPKRPDELSPDSSGGRGATAPEGELP